MTENLVTLIELLIKVLQNNDLFIFGSADSNYKQ